MLKQTDLPPPPLDERAALQPQRRLLEEAILAGGPEIIAAFIGESALGRHG